MFRSMGRMFVLCSKDELKSDLGNDLAKLDGEIKKAAQMKEVLDAKKDTIISLREQATNPPFFSPPGHFCSGHTCGGAPTPGQMVVS